MLNKQTHKLQEADKQAIIRDYVLLGSMNAVSRKHNLSFPTIQRVIRKSKQDNVITKLIAEQKRDIISIIWAKVVVALNAMTKEKISNGALNQLVPVIGVLIEKGLKYFISLIIPFSLLLELFISF